MKSLRNFLIPAGLAIAFALPSASFAQAQTVVPINQQQQQQPGMGHQGGGMGIFRQLNLTPAQLQRIEALKAQYRAAHPPCSTPDPQAARALHQQIMAVLTPAQQAQYQALRAAHKGQHGEHKRAC